MEASPWYIVGLDNGGTTNNATVLDAEGRFLVSGLMESASCVREGPEAALRALGAILAEVLKVTGVSRSSVIGVGLDTPGPATAEGVISAKGSTNFGHADWAGYDIRLALEERVGLPVVYSNDANAAALYAHHAFRCRGDGALFGVGDRRDGAGRRGGRIRPGRPGRVRYGR